MRCLSLVHPPTMIIRCHQIFLGGSSDENEKVLGSAPKKGVPKFFASGGLFFVMEALKTVKTLKTVKSRKSVYATLFFFRG